MPAIPIIIEVVATTAVEEVAGAAITSVLADTVLASASGAIIAGIGGTVGGLIQGESGSDALKGGLAAGAGSYITGALKPALSKEASNVFGASPETASTIGRVGSKIAGGTAAGLVGGGNLSGSLLKGTISAGVGELFPSKDGDSFGQKALTGVERGLAGSATKNIFTPDASHPSGSRLSSTSQIAPLSGSAAQLSSAQSSQPNTAALAQGLRTGDLSAPLFGSDSDDNKKRNAWNVESLKRDPLGESNV